MDNLIKKKFYTPLIPKLHLVINDLAKQNKKLFYYITTQRFKKDALLDFIAKKARLQHKQFDLDYSTIYSYVMQYLDERKLLKDVKHTQKYSGPNNAMD